MNKVKGTCALIVMSMLLTTTSCECISKQETAPEIITLNVLAGQTTVDAGIEDMIDDLVQEKYPNVVLDWKTVEWGSDFEDMLKAYLASGEVPDIIIGKAQDVQTYYKTGNLAQIDDSFLKYYDGMGLRDTTIDGTIYGLPYNMDYQGVIYNKEIFAEYGLPIPKTGEELQQVVSILKANNVTPFAFSGQDITANTMNTMQFMLNELFRKDVNWGRKFRLGQAFMDQSEEMETCFQNSGYLYENSWSDAMEIEPYECNVRFATGEAAMYMTSTWNMSSIMQNSTESTYGIFAYPNTNGNAKLIREMNLTFMKGADTKYSDQVDAILKTIVKSETLESEICDFTRTLPVVKGMKSSYSDDMQADIDAYVENGQVIDSILGYSQLSWNYMDEITEKSLEWMQGSTTFEELLNYANLKREDSDKIK